MAERPLEGKIAIVTGAASPIGLGRAMTLALVKAGARVAMMDVHPDGLDQSAADARQVGGTSCVLTVVGDVSKPEDAERAVQRTMAELGGLHVLVNNAGINPRFVPLPSGLVFSQIPPEVWNRPLAVNTSGPFLMARAAVGHMLS